MTSRERVMAAIFRKPVDRMPVDFKARDDVRDKLIKYLKLENPEQLLQKLGADLRTVSINTRNEAYLKKTNGILRGDSENAGKPYIFKGDGTYENEWGIVYRESPGGLYDEWVSGPFSENPDIEAYDWPSMDIFEDTESIRKRVDAYNGRYAIVGNLNYPFKTCWFMRGWENILCDMMEDEDYVKNLWQKSAEYEIEKGLRLIRAGVDIVGLFGDIAMQDRMMYSVESYRKIDKPIFAEMIRVFKKENPDILVYYHSDGNMEAVIPELIDIGVDIINPVQPECMDVERIKREYGDKIALHGTISIQETLPGPIKGVRRELEDRMRIYGDGGLIVCPSNLIQNDTPMENILEIYRTIRSIS